MSKYPAQIDNIITLPAAVDNSTPVNANIFNNLRSAVLQIEAELGVKPSGISSTVRGRLDTMDTVLLGAVSLSNDLGNTASHPYVIGIQGRPISSQSPVVGEILGWNGIVWMPMLPAPGITTAFSGDIVGLYPTPTVVKIQGNSIKSGALGSIQDGYALTWVNSAGQWQAKPAATGFAAGGDLSGTPTNQTVIKLQGNSVSSSVLGASQDGYQLTWVNASSQWQAKPDGVGFTAGGDLTGTATNQKVISLTGSAGIVTIPSAALAMGASPASAGDMRVGTDWSLQGVNAGNRNLLSWQTGGTLTLGASAGVAAMALYANQFTMYSAGNSYVDTAQVLFRGPGHTAKMLFDFTSEVTPYLQLAGSGDTPANAGMIRIGNNIGAVWNAHGVGANPDMPIVATTATNLTFGDFNQWNTTAIKGSITLLQAAAGSSFQISTGGWDGSVPTNGIWTLYENNSTACLIRIRSAGVSSFLWTATVTGVTHGQSDKAVNNIAGAPLLLQAQNTTVGTALGGDVTIQSGTGVVTSVANQLSSGALIGKVGSVEGLRVTSLGTNLTGGNVVAILGGNSAGTSYCVTAGGYPSFETSNGAIWILPQGSVRTASNLAMSADATSTAFSGPSILYFGVGGNNYMRMRSTELVLGTSYTNNQYQFDFSTAAVFHFGVAASVSASIVYDGVSTATPGATLSITGQNGGTSGVQPGGNVILGSGSGFGGGVAGNTLIQVGGSTKLSLAPTVSSLLATNSIFLQSNSAIKFNMDGVGGTANFASLSQFIWSSTSGVSTNALAFNFNDTGATNIAFSLGTTPSIKQNDNITNSSTGAILTIQAQNATGTTSTGGNLVIQSGTGTNTDGYTYIKTGVTTRLTVKPTGVVTIANLGVGTVQSDASGNLTSGSLGVQNGGNVWKHLIITPFAGTTNTNSGTYVVAGTFELNLSELTAANGTRAITMRCVGETTTPLMSIKLYNVTVAADVTGSTLTTSSTIPVSLVTGDLTANLSAGNAIYQVEIMMAAGGVGDRVILDMANIRIDWT